MDILFAMIPASFRHLSEFVSNMKIELKKEEKIWLPSPNSLFLSLIESGYQNKHGDCSWFINKHIVTYMLTCFKVSYTSYFSQHKHAHPIFLVYFVCKNYIILCLGYSSRQTDFFCVAPLNHRGLGKFIYWKQKERKARKMRIINHIVHTAIQCILNLNQLFIGWQTSFTFTTNISNEVIQLWDHTKWIINLKKIICAANLPLVFLHYLKSCQINKFSC